MVEHGTENAGVDSSILSLGTCGTKLLLSFVSSPLAEFLRQGDRNLKSEVVVGPIPLGNPCKLCP